MYTNLHYNIPGGFCPPSRRASLTCDWSPDQPPRAASMHSLADNRCILHLDADAFFASLEQRDDPKLRGRPVAVGTGVVASCSYEARHYGVRTGMRLAEAHHLCRPL